MDSYHIWCDLNDSSRDLEFCQAVSKYVDFLKAKGHVEGYRIQRRKLGLGPKDLGEFHIMIDTRNLGELDKAWQLAATRQGEVEALHRPLFTIGHNFTFALFRDFPDRQRKG